MGGIRLEFELPAPPARIWPLLTDRGHLASWFTETDFIPEPGQRFMIWPGQALPGIDGPISAVVLTLTPPDKLVMGWQSPRSQTTMTWTLQETRQGTRLRVVEWGHVGADEVVRERTLAELFDVRLRSHLQVAVPVLADPGPGAGLGAVAVPIPVSPALGPAAAVAGPALPGDPLAAGSAAGPAPAAAPPRRRRGALVLIILLLLALVAAVGVWLVWPPGAAGGGVVKSISGQAGMGASPSPAAGAPPDGNGAPGPVSATSTAPSAGGPTTDPSVGPTASPAPEPVVTKLGVTADATGSLLSWTVDVVVTNDGAGTAQWHNVAVGLNGLLVGVTLKSPEVTMVRHGNTVCLIPTGTATLESNSAAIFVFTVTLGVDLSGTLVHDVTLDSPACG
jgi:uncharacterized protein YndB with AHSA1/START domain